MENQSVSWHHTWLLWQGFPVAWDCPFRLSEVDFVELALGTKRFISMAASCARECVGIRKAEPEPTNDCHAFEEELGSKITRWLPQSPSALQHGTKG